MTARRALHCAQVISCHCEVAMTLSAKTWGAFCAMIAGISYGTNPLGGLIMFSEGLNPTSVIFYRFILASLGFAVIMVMSRISFKVSLYELLMLAILGLLFSVSALTLFSSFLYMDAGLASTLFFIYPIFVVLTMAALFHEKPTLSLWIAILFTLIGIGCLYRGDGEGFNLKGVLYVLGSAISYCVYMVVINRSRFTMSAVKMNFYMAIFCLLGITLFSFTSESSHLRPLETPVALMGAIFLAVVPTLVSLTFMVKAIKLIGSTPTSIIGALEPLTAVAIGVLFFNELFTPRMAIGITLIISGVLILVGGSELKTRALQLKDRVKLWRWRN